MTTQSIVFVTLATLKELTQTQIDGTSIYKITIEAVKQGQEPQHDILNIGKEKEGGQLENSIFRLNHNGRKIDLHQLRDWIAEHFVPHLTAKYEWFALWRILMDEGLIASDQTKVSRFTRQMNSWFPNAAVRCAADAVNLYHRGYLGSTPYRNWDRSLFYKEKREKQSMDGFNRLDRLCNDLTEGLKDVELTL